jgi:hypothetical protein
MSKQIFGWNATKKATALPKKKIGANQITTNIIQQCQMQGCTVWRNNVLGIFDIKIGAEAMLDLVLNVLAGKQTIPTKKGVQQMLSECYRKSHERKGASDVLGYTLKGIFLAVEVKADGDHLDEDLMQETFLNDVGMKGGIAFIVATKPDSIKLRVLGSNRRITICHPDDFLKLFIERLKQPLA